MSMHLHCTSVSCYLQPSPHEAQNVLFCAIELTKGSNNMM